MAHYYPFEHAFLGRVATASSTRCAYQSDNLRYYVEAAANDRMGVRRGREEYAKPGRTATKTRWRLNGARALVRRNCMKIFWLGNLMPEAISAVFVVRDVLRDAIEQRREAQDIEEAHSAGKIESRSLDQDMQGVPGSRKLADTILKIGRIDPVVADVTVRWKCDNWGPEASEANQKRTMEFQRCNRARKITPRARRREPLSCLQCALWLR